MRAALLLCGVVVLACAHGPRGASVESLKSAAEQLHQRERWRDWRGVAELVSLPRRAEFLEARRREHDDRDLTVTDYELLDVRLKAGGSAGVVVSRLHWVKLPSVTEHDEEIVSHFEFLDGTWFVDAQEGGPFAAELKP